MSIHKRRLLRNQSRRFFFIFSRNDAVWNAIPPQKPNVLRLFLAKITRNLSLDRFNVRNAEKRGSGEITLVLDELVECLNGGIDTETAYEAKELRQCKGLEFIFRYLASRASVATDAKNGRLPPERKSPVLLVGGSRPQAPFSQIILNFNKQL